MKHRSRIEGRLTRAATAVAFLALVACGQSPEETEAARGVIGEANLVLVLTVVFVVVAGGIILAAVAYDRYVRSRRALEEAEREAEEPEPEEEEEEEETEVAGIGMGTGGVPRWLYAVYVIIPVFAFLYVLTNVQVAEAPEETGEPAETEEPDGGGPDTTLEISAENIAFDTDELVAPADTEITIEFTNNDDGVPHNVAVYETDAMTEEIFVGETFDGVATEEYTFTTPEAGEYYFVCDVHPNMNGTFVVEEADAAAAEDGEDGEEPPEEGPATQVEISAQNIQFNKDELVVPAGTDISLGFENNDSGVPHNVAVYETDAMSDEIFVGELFEGTEVRRYTFTTPEAGEYYFVCDVHPNMNGTFVVEEAGDGG